MPPKIDKVLYTAKAHTMGGREGGASRTSDGRLDVKLSVPGTPGTGTNPEQLLAIGWSACYLSALKLVAGKMKVHFPEDAAVDPEIDLCIAEGGYQLQARMNVSLPGVDRATAEKIAEVGHQTCPYSKGFHGNIDIVTNIVS